MSALEHPEYLEDVGIEGLQFVRHDLALTETDAQTYILEHGYYDSALSVANLEVEAVWMKPRETDDAFAEAWYDVVPEPEGVVRYWRLQP